MSMRYIVEIGDDRGNSCKLSIVVPLTSPRGSWRSIDKGYICVNSGATVEVFPEFFGDSNVFLLNTAGVWGIRLDKFGGYTGVNDEGSGEVVQPWVLSLTPGTISWSLVE